LEIVSSIKYIIIIRRPRPTMSCLFDLLPLAGQLFIVDTGGAVLFSLYRVFSLDVRDAIVLGSWANSY